MGRVHSTYHQFFVGVPNGPIPSPPPCADNGLVGVGDHAVVVYTGIHTGEVEVEVQALPAAPELDSGWEDVVEVSMAAPGGPLVVQALMADVEDAIPPVATGPGSYRLRVHARGRDTLVDGVPFELVEWYLIQVWPAPPAPTAMLRSTSSYGADLRRAGSRS